MTAAALLTKVQEVLSADSTVAALVSDRIYGAAPNNATYPYVTIATQTEPWNTASYSAARHVLTVQAFDKNEKQGVALAIREAVYEALHRKESSLTITGKTVVMCEHDGVSTCFLGDGKVWQAVIEFVVTIQ